MTKASNTKSTTAAFTLIELMIVVAIIGILAAIALPSFSLYIRTVRSAEATTNLSTMFKGASSYYAREVAAKGLGASASGSCSVPSTAGTLPAAPDDQKHQVDFSAVPTYEALGFSSPDPVYFGYGVTSAGATCGNTGNTDIYTFYAIGDLDGDGNTGLIELAASSDPSNVLRHAVGFYLHEEWE
jgi:prepilin-type N-terminal cleavage/methylation domain-containing protein